MRKDYYIFNISYILRTVGFGIFVSLFNLYILSINNFSEYFLEVFLAIGNLSMAVTSYFVGVLIDKYSKKRLMIIFTLMCCICMFAEIMIKNEPIMYLISILYGIGAVGLFTLTPTVLKAYENEDRKNLIITNRAINIVSLTMGSILSGIMTGQYGELSESRVMLGGPILYLLSAFIFLFHSGDKRAKGICYVCCNKEKSEKQHYLRLRYILIVIILFLLLGFAPMLVNYVNVYFKNRFLLDVYKIAYIYACICFMSGFFILLLSKIDYKNSKYIMWLFMCTVFVNFVLMLFNNLFIQILCVFLYISLYEVLTSCVYEFVLSSARKDFYGRLSGIIQASSNLSETIGIYMCGLCLGKKMYVAIFGLGIITTVISAVVAIVFLGEKNG